MHKFGSTGILTGYIKQLLKSFNLPTARIYTKEQADYVDSQIKKHILVDNERYDVIESQLNNQVDDGNDVICYVPYIRDNKLQIYAEGKWQELGGSSNPTHRTYYSRGQHLLNRTKNFQIKDNVYDYYTHEYLGDYLRFIRDYDGIDLMPLYNCFSNHLVENLEFSFNDPETGRKVFFDITDESYKIYMLPVKLFKAYTIAIDSDSTIELCCGVYNANIVTDGELGTIPGRTYLRKNSSQFSYPFLYDNLITTLYPALTAENADHTYTNYIEQKKQLTLLAQQERDLKLFIKVPSTAKSSIVILEGDYRSWNDFVLVNNSTKSNQLVEESSSFGVSDFMDKQYEISYNVYLKNEQDGSYIQQIKTTSCFLYKETETNFRYYFPEINNYLDAILKDQVIEKAATTTSDGNLNFKITIPLLEGEYIDSKGNRPANGSITTSIAIAHWEPEALSTAPPSRFEKHYNRSIISNELIASGDETSLITPLQLLRLNTQIQTPFADRLIEYLMGNVIANTEDVIAENVKLAQTIAQLHFIGASSKANGLAPASQAKIYRYSPTLPGVWDNSLRNIFYQYMTSQTSFETAHDVLGYVDKDVEKLFIAEVRDSKAEPRQQTMINTDIWEV